MPFRFHAHVAGVINHKEFQRAKQTVLALQAEGLLQAHVTALPPALWNSYSAARKASLSRQFGWTAKQTQIVNPLDPPVLVTVRRTVHDGLVPALTAEPRACDVPFVSVDTGHRVRVPAVPDVAATEMDPADPIPGVIMTSRLEKALEAARRDDDEAHGVQDAFVFVGNGTRFLAWVRERFPSRPEDTKSDAVLTALANNEYKLWLESKKDNIAFLEVSIEGRVLGKMIFELYGTICPKTVTNFKAMLTGNFLSAVNGKPLTYKGTLIHRVVRNGWIQGGDVLGSSGGTGESIYGPTFADENFTILHDRPGILSMSNHGPHTNNSQFQVTLAPMPAFNKKYVAFGGLIEGTEVLDFLNSESSGLPGLSGGGIKVDKFERPVGVVAISDGGFSGDQ